MVLRSSMLWLARNRRAEELIRGTGVVRPLVNRFVAGEDLDAALAQVRTMRDAGMQVTLDLLGENVSHEEDAETACNAYVDMLDRIHAAGFDPNISIKLTMLGLDIDDELAWEKLQRIV